MSEWTWRDSLASGFRQDWCFWRHLGHRWRFTGAVVKTRFGVGDAKECVRCGAWRAW